MAYLWTFGYESFSAQAENRNIEHFNRFSVYNIVLNGIPGFACSIKESSPGMVDTGDMHIVQAWGKM